MIARALFAAVVVIQCAAPPGLAVVIRAPENCESQEALGVGDFIAADCVRDPGETIVIHPPYAP